MSRAPNELDWRQLPLLGRALIEASAGTGKTYNIALLHLRLVLEQGLSVREVVVCTFTEAAASELTERLRQRLRQAHDVLLPLSQDADPGPGADPALVEWLIALADTQPAAVLLERSRSALADLDLAPISTIHSYCRRLLNDYPFDSGSAFRPGETADQSALIAECVEDWWRQRYQVDAICRLESALLLPQGPAALARRVDELWRVRHAHIIAPPSQRLRDLAEELYSAPRLAQLQALLDAPNLFRQSNSRLRTRLTELLEMLQGGAWQQKIIAELEEINDPDLLAKQVSRTHPHRLAQNAFFQWLKGQLPTLLNLQSLALNSVAAEALDFVLAEVPKRLDQRDQISFDGMIEQVWTGLHGDGGAALADRIFAAMPAALIDEFQDTDLQQWAIFDRIYRNEDGVRGSLILIGDPKQSIYGFRGADVHAYLAAKRSIPLQRSISTNYRSSSALIEALNALYHSAGAAAFNAEQIRYQQVSSRPDAPTTLLSDAAGPITQGLRIRRFDDLPSTLSKRDELILSRCADDVCRVLGEDGWQLQQRPLQPADIAVLVGTNHHLQRIREMLHQRGVPVVGSGRAGVFESGWARQIQILLHALLHPGRERELRAALATELLGWRALDLLELETDAALWELQLQRFAEWAALWRERGVLALLQPIIAEAAPRLLRRADGERALTDLRHLAELLEQAASDCYGPEALLAWLVKARADGGATDAGREHQLRVESDAARVQLSTIHGSKGLEYNCVFLPMAWRAKGRYTPGFARFHDADDRLCVDLGSNRFEDRLDQHLNEELSERMRLLYVALTRARHGCVLYAPSDLGVGGPHTWQLSELGRLLGTALRNTDADGEQRWPLLQAQIPQLLIDSSATPPGRYRAPAAATPRLSARGPLPPPRPYRGLYSFSALSRRAQPASDAAAPGAEDELQLDTLLPNPASADQGQLTLRLPDPRLQALADWRGPAFGDALHQIFERRALGVAMADQLELVSTQLRGVAAAQGSSEEQLSKASTAVAELVQRTLDTPLQKGLSLGRLSGSALCAEMEFCFTLDNASLDAINRSLRRHGQAELPAQVGDTLRGLMTGFIDLIFEWQGRFHLLDYKSNDLGMHSDDYAASALDAAMDAHHYRLQSLIYAVALQRYLRQRLPGYAGDKHLGSSWYLFVRGVGLDQGCGIWQQPIAVPLIDELDALFGGSEPDRSGAQR